MKPLILATLVLALGMSGASALDFSRHRNDNATLLAILATGPIEDGDAGRFRAYLARSPAKKRTVIYLDSPGGSLYDGMALGRAFYELGIRTVIEGGSARCLSACALAFLGGRDGGGKPWRTKSSSSELGFHAFRSSHFSAGRVYTGEDMYELEQQTQRTVLDVADYLRFIGTDLDFLRIMFRASSQDMNYVSNAEALRMGIRVWDEASNRFLVP